MVSHWKTFYAEIHPAGVQEISRVFMALPPHQLKVVLVEPEIPQNTGNIARLCAVTGAVSHLVRPLGFFLTEKYLKLAGMDYLNNVRMTVHDDLPALWKCIGPDSFWLTSASARRPHWDRRYRRWGLAVFRQGIRRAARDPAERA